MKQYVSIFIVLCLFLVIGNIVIAHAPSSMNLEYNSVTERLTVDITHSVADGDTHYVDNIRVTVNGETEINQDYTSQSGSSFTYTYEDVYANETDTIEVLANCNQGGLITKSLVVTGDQSSTQDDSSTPGFESVLLFIALILTFFVLKRKRQ